MGFCPIIHNYSKKGGVVELLEVSRQCSKQLVKVHFPVTFQVSCCNMLDHVVTFVCYNKCNKYVTFYCNIMKKLHINGSTISCVTL